MFHSAIYAILLVLSIALISVQGDTWSFSNAVNTQAWCASGMSYDGKYGVIAGCQSSGEAYYSSDYGATWTKATVTASFWGFAAMSGTGQYAVLAASTSGRLFYSSDYGQTYTASNFKASAIL